MSRKYRNLGIESLEGRELLAQYYPYTPLAGAGVNLEAMSMSYNPSISDSNHLTTRVRITNPTSHKGGFNLNVYWEDGAGRRSPEPIPS